MSEDKSKKSKPRRKKIDGLFAENLTRILKERSVTLKAAAELAEVAPNVMSSWTSGSMPHDLLAVQRLAKALHVDFEWLLTGEHANKTRSNPSLSELFQEEKAFSGIYRIEATKLIRKGKNEREDE